MAIQLTERNSGRILEVQLSGKIVHEDYQHFVPESSSLTYKHFSDIERRRWLGTRNGRKA